ncbi:predicted protein [Chaetoceros tenuissimus]|uniref:Uncharacterized protein n=1 Tax=Chaetoceros tenuissimus TaxID=426638 RepID=A0AAD3D3B5_9STRA|nr:predicted protein [Chaetoceros tenuissimus]
MTDYWPSVGIPEDCLEILLRNTENYENARNEHLLEIFEKNHFLNFRVLLEREELREQFFKLFSSMEFYYSYYDDNDDERAIRWAKSINNEEAYALHRACSSSNPIAETIHDLVKRQGIEAMRMKNAIGITPSQYLAANTFADISGQEIINRYISEMMGDVF